MTVHELGPVLEVDEVLEGLDHDFVALQPVKARIREIASLLIVDQLRHAHQLAAERPSLHMCFTGNPGTGKTTIAMRMASLLHRLGYLETDRLVAVTRDDLVGQYVGHTAPKTRKVLERAFGGVLFIDEAYYLHRPENERDYGVEAIEILLQVMENRREDLVVILAGYEDRMDTFFSANPGMGSRIAHHVDFPDYDAPELLAIADLMLERHQYEFAPGARDAFHRWIERRMLLPRFGAARSVRNGIERSRLRQAARLVEAGRHGEPLTRERLRLIEPGDVLGSRVFTTHVPELDGKPARPASLAATA